MLLRGELPCNPPFSLLHQRCAIEFIRQRETHYKFLLLRVESASGSLSQRGPNDGPLAGFFHLNNIFFIDCVRWIIRRVFAIIFLSLDRLLFFVFFNVLGHLGFYRILTMTN